MANRRKIPPIPLDILMNDPRIVGLPSAALLALIRLTWYSWTTDCQMLTVNTSGLFAISRCNPGTWRVYNIEIIEILGDVIRELKAARDYSDVQRAKLIEMSKRMQASTKLRHLKKVSAPAELPREISARRSETTRQARAILPTGRDSAGQTDGFKD